jgi:hypothetical protein
MNDAMSLVEKIMVERNREINNAILGTIVNIANENGIAITLNEQAIIDALKKQIPKKPVNKTKHDNSTAKHYENCNIVVCPLCNGRLKLKSKGKYCDKCGQALDWSDTE